MDKLEKLTQDGGSLYRANGISSVHSSGVYLRGKIRTLVVASPCFDISEVIDEMAGRDSLFIPKGANAYVASDFNGGTQHVRQDGSERDTKMYSVYALQFYSCNYLPPIDR